MEQYAVPKVPKKTGVRNPKKLTDEEKNLIIQKIREINKDDGISLLPEGSGEFSGTPALIDIDKNGNARIINPSNAYKDWVDYKPVFKKNPDETYQVIDSDKISIIKAEDLLTDIKPDPPTITADDDKLTFAPKSIDTDAKTITINYDDPQGTKKTATITKNDGTWTSSDDNVTVDGGVISLLTSKVNPGSTVTATVTDNAGQTSEPNSQKIAESVKPPTVTPDKTTGKVTITPPVDVDGMEISYTPAGEGATETKIIAKKDNGTWKIDGDKLKGVEIDSNGVVTIDKGKAKEKSEVKAKSKLGTKESTESKGTVPDKTGPKPPEVKVDPSTGNVHITPPTDPDVKTIEVKYPGTDGHEKKFTATKTDTGWEFTGNNGETIEGQSGKITIPYGNLKKADTISAIAKDEDGNPSTEGIDTSLPPAPGVKLDEGNGVIIVTPPTEKAPSVDGMEITYTPAGEGTSETKLVAKKVGGKWSINNIPEGVKIDKNSGVVTITNDKAKAESKVVAYSSIDTNKKSKEKGEAKVPNTTAPEAPTVKVQDNGSVTITPKDKGETSVTVTYNKADATPVTVEAKKSDGQWKIENKTNGESVDPTTGVITIPTGNTNPGDRVKATAKKGSRTSTESNDLTKPAPPTVNPDQNSGNVTITPPTKGNVDGMIIKYKKPDKSEGTIKVKKGKGGTWTFDGENPDSEGVEVNGQSGVVTIKKGHAKEKTPVTADSTIENLKTPDINQGEQPKLVPDKTAPEAPTVTVDENAGNLTITPPSDDDTTSVTVTYKKDANTEIKVKAKKTGNTWSLTKEDGTTPVDNDEKVDQNSGAITIPKGKYKTGEEVVAFGNDDAKNKSAEKNATPVEVSFDGNTGGGSMDSKIVVVGKENKQQGQSAVVPAKFTLPECKFTAPDGKEFAGWLVGNGNEAKAVGTTIDVSANVTIKAKWKAKGTGTNPPGTGGSGTGGSTQDPSQPGTGTNPEPTPSNPEPGNPTQGSENPKANPTDPAKNDPDQKDKPEDKKTGEDNKNNPKTPNVEKGDKVINVGDKEVVVPKVVVDKKKGKLDKEERTKIAEKIKEKNPDVVDVKIDEKANAVVTFSNGRRERIPAKDLLSKEGFMIPRRDRHSQDESPNRRRAGKNVKTGVESIAGIACTLVASTGALYIGRKKED